MTDIHQAAGVAHETMRDEIDRIKRFFRIGNDNRDLDHVARALEDLPEDVREQARMVLDVPDGDSFAKRVFDVTEDVAVDLYGSLERVKYLHFLSQYRVTSYMYEMSRFLSRGSRPSAARLVWLAGEGYVATVNLCAEMPNGDAPEIESAGLSGSLKTLHIPITDGTPPEFDQVMKLLIYLADLEAGRVYLHCEAGKARTGVMAACCRMAIMGWSLDDALLEAGNFGCSIPMQLDFIQDFGRQLASGDLAAGYPSEPLGSHILTAAEREATLAKVAATEKGMP
jgi:hypothetical protein